MIQWKTKTWVFQFLISCALKDFRLNVRSCNLRTKEKKQLINKINQRVKVLT